MNYEGWSKSIELDRTLTPDFVTVASRKTKKKHLNRRFDGNEVKAGINLANFNSSKAL